MGEPKRGSWTLDRVNWAMLIYEVKALLVAGNRDRTPFGLSHKRHKELEGF